MQLLSAQVLIVEKLLWEKDEVFSAIRIVDRFASPAIGPSSERVPIQLAVLGLTRYIGPSDKRVHRVYYELVRPSGEVKLVGEPQEFTFSDAGDFNVTGLNFPVIFHVAPREQGLHYVVFKIDDAEVARAVFTLVLLPPEEYKG